MVNPVAGGSRSQYEDTVRKIQDFAEDFHDNYEIYITKEPMDACRKIKEDAENADMLHVYACGGDGTLNECANGAANRTNVAITQYPCGTGNDFLKTFGHDNIHKFRDLEALANGAVRPIDLIDCNGRYGINICSVGIDARVGGDVHKYSNIPIIGGSTGYVVSLLVNVIKGVTQKLKIVTVNGTRDNKVTLACACNGRFYGGGFNPVPEAIPDDGIIEFLVVEPVSRLKVAQIVGRFAKGRYREFPDIIKHERGEFMDISGEKEFVVNIDGEIIKTKNISFKVIPSGINFIFPDGVGVSAT